MGWTVDAIRQLLYWRVCKYNKLMKNKKPSPDTQGLFQNLRGCAVVGGATSMQATEHHRLEVIGNGDVKS